MESLAELEVRSRLFGLFTNIFITEGKMFIGMNSVDTIPESFYQLKCVERIFLCLYFGPIPEEVQSVLRNNLTSDDKTLNPCECREFVASLGLKAAVQACRNSSSRSSGQAELSCADVAEKVDRGGISWRVRCRGSWRKCNTEALAQALYVSTNIVENAEVIQVESPQDEVVVHISDAGAFVGLALTKRTLSLRASALRSVSDADASHGKKGSKCGVRSTVAYGMCLRSETCASRAADGRDGGSTAGAVVLDPVCGRGGVLLEAMRAWPAGFVLGSDVCMTRLVEAQLAVAEARLPAATREEGAGGIVELIACDATALPLRAGWVTRVVADMPFGKQHRLFSPRSHSETRTDDKGAPIGDEGGDGMRMVQGVMREAWRVTAEKATACILTAHEKELGACASVGGEWEVVERDSVQLGTLQGIAMVTLLRIHPGPSQSTE
jgi:hypothetical protein